MIKHVYELMDVTHSGCEYECLGFFLSADDAVKSATQGDEPPVDDPEEFCHMNVVERPIGLHAEGTIVRRIEWLERYDEGADEYNWGVPTVTVMMAIWG